MSPTSGKTPNKINYSARSVASSAAMNKNRLKHAFQVLEYPFKMLLFDWGELMIWDRIVMDLQTRFSVAFQQSSGFKIAVICQLVVIQKADDALESILFYFFNPFRYERIFDFRFHGVSWPGTTLYFNSIDRFE